MFRSIDKSSGYPFATGDLGRMLEATQLALRKEIEELPENRFLNTAQGDLVAYLVEKYSVEAVHLLREEWYVDYKDALVDVRHDQMRWIEDRRRPAMVAGQHIEVHVPFSGESELLYARASQSTFNPPRAEVEGSELVLRYQVPADAQKDVRPEVDRTLNEIEQHLGWQKGQIDAHNQTLAQAASAGIANRRSRLLAQSQRAEGLGIPVRRRADAPKTYAIPTVRKKAAPVLPAASSAAFTPEPAWATEQYEAAIKIIQDMTLVMERSPQAFRTLDEEAIRHHFLMQLNAQFEGKATAETFNMGGKTDILLREGDRNVFIAECKFWKGPAKFREAIDQLLGYATWRDSKTAILVFNRETALSTVLKGVDETMKAHSNFKRVVNWPHETGFRYVLHAESDKNRELTVTVLVFDVPHS